MRPLCTCTYLDLGKLDYHNYIMWGGGREGGILGPLVESNSTMYIVCVIIFPICSLVADDSTLRFQCKW